MPATVLSNLHRSSSVPPKYFIESYIHCLTKEMRNGDREGLSSTERGKPVLTRQSDTEPALCYSGCFYRPHLCMQSPGQWVRIAECFYWHSY